VSRASTGYSLRGKGGQEKGKKTTPRGREWERRRRFAALMALSRWVIGRFGGKKKKVQYNIKMKSAILHSPVSCQIERGEEWRDRCDDKEGNGRAEKKERSRFCKDWGNGPFPVSSRWDETGGRTRGGKGKVQAKSLICLGKRGGGKNSRNKNIKKTNKKIKNAPKNTGLGRRAGGTRGDPEQNDRDVNALSKEKRGGGGAQSVGGKGGDGERDSKVISRRVAPAKGGGRSRHRSSEICNIAGRENDFESPSIPLTVKGEKGGGGGTVSPVLELASHGLKGGQPGCCCGHDHHERQRDQEPQSPPKEKGEVPHHFLCSLSLCHRERRGVIQGFQSSVVINQC